MRFRIDLSDTFPNLPGAPIAEAVIHWRARAEAKLDPERVREQLAEKLPDYPAPQPQQEIQVGGQFGADHTAMLRRDHWHGFRFESHDKRYVAQFTRNGFVFSRLEPYENWGAFEAEALRLWDIYREIAAPSEIQRLGVRFINRIAPVAVARLDQYLVVPPNFPAEFPLPLEGFLYQSRFDVPGYPYNLNVNQTIQPAEPSKHEESALLFDIDVFTTSATALDDEIVRERLREMQWLKNTTFFTFLTQSAIDAFKEESK